MKKTLSCLFALLMILCSCAAPAAGEGFRYEGDGFDTPEEALMCYVAGIKALDFQKILSAFAWETQASHYSIEMNLKRIGSFSPTMKPRIPSDHPFAVSANLEAIRSQQIDYIYHAIEGLMMGEHYHDGMPVTLRNDNELSDFIGYFDSGKLDLLSGMTNIRLIAPEQVITDSNFQSEHNMEFFRQSTAVYGGDEARNIIALADLSDGTVFYCCPTLIRYGSKWYIVTVTSYTSQFLGINPYLQAFCCGTMSEMLR